MLLLDNQAQNSIFCREDLLTNLRDRQAPSLYKGVGQGSITASQEGDFLDFITVDFSPDAATNLVSWAQAIKAGANITYNSDADEFELSIGDKSLTFEAYNNLYVCRIKTSDTSGTLAMFNRREEAEMLIGNEVRRRLGFPSNSGLDFIVLSGAITNIPVSTQIIAALPESIQYLQGKQARKMIKKNPTVSTAMVSQETNSSVTCST